MPDTRPEEETMDHSSHDMDLVPSEGSGGHAGMHEMKSDVTRPQLVAVSLTSWEHSGHLTSMVGWV